MIPKPKRKNAIICRLVITQNMIVIFQTLKFSET